VSKLVAFSEGTYNPVSQMGDPACFELFSSEELDAIQWDTLEEEMANAAEYDINPDYAAMYDLYAAAKRTRGG
jgi:spermidine/putrescine transport system substrate-binding protein